MAASRHHPIGSTGARTRKLGHGPVRTGLDRLLAGEGPDLRGQRVSALCNAASITSDLRHLRQALELAGACVSSFLGPEHGLRGTAQDMEGVTEESSDITPTYSLYGKEFSSLIPEPEMFHDASWLLCDLQDVGSRHYTFVWSIVLAAEVALGAGLNVLVLDRPNPLGGTDDWVEGGTIDQGQESFVGLHPVATRHGMTVGELCRMAIEERGKVDVARLSVLRCVGWRRDMLFPDTGLTWVLPSPNMPFFDTAVVYPGQCLIEGTNLSEGRGHTRPFETFGAPWVDGAALAAAISAEDAPGLGLRPVTFKPTFHKHANTTCGGLQLHILDPARVRSLRTTWALLNALWASSAGHMRWRRERYEFVDDRPALDLLAGGPWLRQAIEAGAGAAELVRSNEAERTAFLKRRQSFLLYEEG